MFYWKLEKNNKKKKNYSVLGFCILIFKEKLLVT